MHKKTTKSKQADSNGLLIELAVVPKDAMVKPKSILIKIERKSIESIRRALS
jgi:hypothetical protein